MGHAAGGEDGGDVVLGGELPVEVAGAQGWGAQDEAGEEEGFVFAVAMAST